MQIVNFFYELAREHKRIRGFYYGKAYNKGAGNAVYPLIWVDDPIAGRSVNQTLQYIVNVDILGMPANDADIASVQQQALTIGLTIEEKIKQDRPGFTPDGISFISVSDYYDDNAAGFRFTFTLKQANPVDRCNDDFDPDKKFSHEKALPDFSTDHPDGCAIFEDKQGLPNFRIRDPEGCAIFPNPPEPTAYDLTYHISGATPDTITKTYNQGTEVTLSPPEQLGMALPDNYVFLGWQIDGQTVTEVVMDGDKTAEGLYRSDTVFKYILCDATGYAPDIHFRLVGDMAIRVHWGDGYTEDISHVGAGNTVYDLTHVHPQGYKEYVGRIEYLSGSGHFEYGAVNTSVVFMGTTIVPSYKDALTGIISGSERFRLSSYSFPNCRSCTLLDFSRQTEGVIGSASLSGLYSLKKITLPPNVVGNAGSALLGNACSIEEVEIPEGISNYEIGFQNMYSCRRIIIRRSTPATITATTFNNLPPTAQIFVPDESIELYPVATNWPKWAPQIYPLSQLPIE